MTDYLSAIVARKRRENARRRRHMAEAQPVDRPARPERSERGIRALRREPGAPPAVIAEVKFRSPSAGEIRPWSAGEGVRVALGYEAGGASAVSVLADGPGFGGSPLLVRRVAETVRVPVLYKGFVLDPIQVDLAYDVGASLVLLLVRALEDSELAELIRKIRSLGMEPIVEAANSSEVDRAVAAGSTIVGVNARGEATHSNGLQIASIELDEPILVTADPDRIRQVVWNLVRNAVQASPHQGKVEVRTGKDDAGNAFLEVTDEGKGIQAAQRERLFDMFYSGRSHGVGLGLALVKQIVDQHRGRIEVIDREVVGTCFRVTLPDGPASIKPSSTTRPAARSGSRPA